MARNITVALELDARNFNRNLQTAGDNVDRFESTTASATESLKGAFQALAGAIAIKEVVALGDEFTNLNNRLKVVTQSNAEAAQAFALVKDIANGTRNDIGAVGDLFTNLSIATADMGLNMTQVGDITKTFSQTLKISGADAAASEGAIRQFGQALASGTLRGDEFNSIMEANPVFMRAMAEAMGAPIGALRDMAADGQLTSEIIVAAANDMSAAMTEQFGQTIPTISESFTVLKNNAIAFLGELENRTHIFENLSKLVLMLAENLDILGAIMAGVFAAAVVGRIISIVNAVIAFTKALQAAAVAGTILQGVTGVGLVKVAAGLAAAGAAVATMNTMFEDQDDIVKGLTASQTELTTAQTENATTQIGNTAEVIALAKKEHEQLLQQMQTEADRAEEQAKQSEKRIDAINKENDTMMETLIREEEKRQELEEQKALHHEKEMARAQAVLEQAAAKAEADLNDINATVEKIGLSETQIKQLEATNELNREREQKLAELAKYNITDAEKNELQAELNALYDDQIAKQIEAIAVTDEQQRSFTTGWKNAWAAYKDAANNNAKLAGDMFNTVTRGMEDAFVNFVETGKLNFRDLISDMIRQLLRIVAKKIFIKIIDLLTGGLGSLFEGFFDTGGRIGAGKFGVVGEKGPEIVYGPATVIGRQETADMLSGAGGAGGTVVYNINAVDARSFRELVASDPEFIYNVTLAGRRSLPA